MTSKERVIGMIRGQKVDRVPIYAPSPTGEVIGQEERLPDRLPWGFSDEWKSEDSNYQAILSVVEEYCDTPYTYSFPELDRRFLLIPEEFHGVAEFEENDNSLKIRHRIHSPRGDLEYVEEKKKNISTTWCRKPLLESEEDVEKILSVPYYSQESDIGMFSRETEKVGQDRVIQVFVSTPLVCVCHLFGFEVFLTWCLLRRSIIDRLLETVFERIYAQLELLLKGGVGPIFRFGGSEHATPPLMSPELYEDLVVRYDRQLFDLVHRYGALVGVHCHGNIATVFDRIVEMGADLLDPVEETPDGDIMIEEAKEKAKGRTGRVGNIQFRDLEFCYPSEVDRKVKRMICSGGKERIILSATEGPITYVSDRLRDNYLRLIKSGIEYGSFG